MAAWTGVVGRWWMRRGAAWTTLAVVLFLEGSLVFGAVLPLGTLDSVSGAVAVLALQLLVLLMLASGIIVTSADPGYVPLQPASAADVAPPPPPVKAFSSSASLTRARAP